MSKFTGKKLSIEIFGESHSPFIGVEVSGLNGQPLYTETINDLLLRRKATKSVFSTPRLEADEPVYYGVKDGRIVDTFKGVIENKNVRSKDYSPLYAKPRPSHADYAWYLKNGTLDFSGGGRFSGRLTAPLCIAGGECKGILEQKGIKIAAYVNSVGNVKGVGYKDRKISYEEIIQARNSTFPSLSDQEKMIEEITKYASVGNSVGARVECLIFGLKGGIGDDYFEGLEGKISSMIYSVPAVKGVEFGYGFDFCSSNGKDANDELRYLDGEVEFLSNASGGINGGISNGNVITIGVAIKPTPSIALPQQTIDIEKKTNVEISVTGRHDPCLAPRALPAIESAIAIALLDEIL